MTGRAQVVTEKYLARYAEPEALLAERASRRWARALCVPACGEAPELLDGFRDAARAAAGRTLVILVVNARENAAASVHEQNRSLLSQLGGKGVHDAGELDVWLVDRASPGRRLPEKQGVGLARRIACDVAVALRARGHLDDRFVYSTDADVELPRGYFSVARAAPEQTSSIVFPFWHVPSGRDALDRATALYEISLRYYVLGLQRARSPHALHTLGSAFAVDSEAYAKVRGFPRRQAGEDFHLLAKLLKIAPVLRANAAEPVNIRARRSSRVPFGTGPAVARLEAGAPLRLYHPRAFDVVRDVLDAIDAFATERDVQAFFERVGRSSVVIESTLRDWGAANALVEIAQQAKSLPQLYRRAHEWLDALRTLKLVHALRATTHPSLPWQQALRQAQLAGDELVDLDAVRRALMAAESRGLCGPMLPR